MRTYAYVMFGVVAQIIPPEFYPQDSPEGSIYEYSEGEYIPLDRRYTPEFRATCVDITDMDPQPQAGWVATPDGDTWSLAPYVAPPPTDAQIIASNTAMLQAANQLATAQKIALTNRIGTLQDAIDNIGVEGMEEFAATPAEVAELPVRKAQYSKWKNYAILLGRVTAQTGWALTVVWPAQPAEGMDLSVSAAAPETV